MPIDPQTHVPVFEQIVDHICGSVSAGIYRPGDMLPSIRALAQELIVNPNTVQRAYQELERRQLITTRKGLGVFVTQNGHDTARHLAETAVRSRFVAGITLGRAADIPPKQLESLFRTTLESSQPPSVSPDREQPATPSSQEPSS